MTAPDKPRRRRLSGEDHALWRTVTRTVVPLKRKRAAPAVADEPPKIPALSGAPKTTRTKNGKAAPIARAPATAAKAPPPLAPIERRLKQRLARGQVEIDARLDLHGRTQSEAHAALARFLHRAQSNGARTVLVITGKGDADEGRGVLRRQVPLWLAQPELRGCVLGIEVAHRAHGGAGALYVRLRRER